MQIILNLQSNALKFTQKGFVQIKTILTQTQLIIQVIDTGAGIDKANQDKLFKLFGFVKDTQQVNIHGIGLGLMIC